MAEISNEDLDDMLAWLERQNYSNKAVGHAIRRVSELGSLEHMVTFITMLRKQILNKQVHRKFNYGA